MVPTIVIKSADFSPWSFDKDSDEDSDEEEQDRDECWGSYQYPPLRNPKSIRLFRLLPGVESDESITGIIFEVAPLEKKSPFDESSYDVSYEALSWTWDSEWSAVHVMIQDNDHQYLLPVSNNLSQALTSLRLETASRTLWIDALCINQANSWELNHQMPMLPSIYANASRCLRMAWACWQG